MTGTRKTLHLTGPDPLTFLSRLAIRVPPAQWKAYA